MTQPNAKLVEVARVLWDEGERRWCAGTGDDPIPFPGPTHPDAATSLNEARAAIRALMEPSEDMVEAGGAAPLNMDHDVGPRAAERAYRAMLAKVLEEEG